MNDLVNLLVDLQGEQFGERALARALNEIENAGFTVERATAAPEAMLAWIDLEFGGSWSSEAFAGANVVARKSAGFAGFCTYDARDLRFAWLRGLGSEEDVGVFGPFGVAPQDRGSRLGPNLLIAALASLREAGYRRALIPAVGEEKLVAYYARHCGARVAERFPRAKWQNRRFRTVVMASGSGTNFQSVIDRIREGRLPLDPVLLLSNKTGAFALERARRANIPACALPWERKAYSRERYDAQLLERVEREQPDLLLLLGWMHVLDDRFVAAFPQTINIHPAFLPLDQLRDHVTFPDGSVTPAFRGAKAVADALAWGSRWAGASAHRVTLDADRGPVLVRKPLAIEPGEDEASIMRRLHPLEHGVLAAAIMRWVYEA